MSIGDLPAIWLHYYFRAKWLGQTNVQPIENVGPSTSTVVVETDFILSTIRSKIIMYLHNFSFPNHLIVVHWFSVSTSLKTFGKVLNFELNSWTLKCPISLVCTVAIKLCWLHMCKRACLWSYVSVHVCRLVWYSMSACVNIRYDVPSLWHLLGCM